MLYLAATHTSLFLMDRQRKKKALRGGRLFSLNPPQRAQKKVMFSRGLTTTLLKRAKRRLLTPEEQIRERMNGHSLSREA